MRQRQPVPVMALRRYLRTWEEPFKFLVTLERSLGIQDANYRNLRRAISDFRNLNARNKIKVADKLLQYLRSKLPNTDIARKVQEIVKNSNITA